MYTVFTMVSCCWVYIVLYLSGKSSANTQNMAVYQQPTAQQMGQTHTHLTVAYRAFVSAMYHIFIGISETVKVFFLRFSATKLDRYHYNNHMLFLLTLQNTIVVSVILCVLFIITLRILQTVVCQSVHIFAMYLW